MITRFQNKRAYGRHRQRRISLASCARPQSSSILLVVDEKEDADEEYHKKNLERKISSDISTSGASSTFDKLLKEGQQKRITRQNAHVTPVVWNSSLSDSHSNTESSDSGTLFKSLCDKPAASARCILSPAVPVTNGKYTKECQNKGTKGNFGKLTQRNLVEKDKTKNKRVRITKHNIPNPASNSKTELSKKNLRKLSIDWSEIDAYSFVFEKIPRKTNCHQHPNFPSRSTVNDDYQDNSESVCVELVANGSNNPSKETVDNLHNDQESVSSEVENQNLNLSSESVATTLPDILNFGIQQKKQRLASEQEQESSKLDNVEHFSEVEKNGNSQSSQHNCHSNSCMLENLSNISQCSSPEVGWVATERKSSYLISSQKTSTPNTRVKYPWEKRLLKPSKLLQRQTELSESFNGALHNKSVNDLHETQSDLKTVKDTLDKLLHSTRSSVFNMRLTPHHPSKIGNSSKQEKQKDYFQQSNDASFSQFSADLFQSREKPKNKTRQQIPNALNLQTSALVNREATEDVTAKQCIEENPDNNKKSVSVDMFLEVSSALDSPVSSSFYEFCPSAVKEVHLKLQAEELCRSLRVVLTPLQASYRGRISLITPVHKVLALCGQNEPISFSVAFPQRFLSRCKKIGEGVYGEVFHSNSPQGEEIAIKIVPIEGDFPVNEESQKNFEEILPEIVVSQELTKLNDDKENMTSTFISVKRVMCVQGKYPIKLLQEWDKFAKNKSTLNDRPDIFDTNQLYIIFEFSDGGCDLESFHFTSAEEAVSVLKQVACALAVAEEALQYEHRDLHWGNILVARSTKENVEFTFKGKKLSFPACGVFVSIIDFTLSRFTKDGCTVFTDLSNDLTLFTGEGDYQFEIYRLMRKHNQNEWESFHPFTNILWLHYLAEKLVNSKKYKSRSKNHRVALGQLRSLMSTLLKFQSASDFIQESYTS
ncbi:uncharacterized protein LOC106465607 [Limulus polyphemus]|uniref:non-specific serine/threonine protein kinase n=1 Tax=Limulus polyphemus TaxID=6850 RepID=A0ABM1T034_LIMPO|nr:uncharacterized protein LOC106465607 [Limulus polyphemus]XP_022249241.1 uncharacterized protein LOC106465607 [Limulus polyphemus]